MSVGRATGEIDIKVSQAERNLESLEGQLRRFDQNTSQGLRGMSSVIDQNAEHFNALGRAMTGAGLAGVGAFGFMINSAANFEQSMSRINAVTDLTESEFSQLRDLILELGESTIYSATESALAVETLAKAGISVKDIMGGAADAALELAAASGGDLVQSTEILSAAMAAFNIEGAEATRVTDALAGAANVSLADMTDLGYGLAQVGGIANSFGFTIEETSAALAVMAQNGLSGSDAATSMKTTLLKLVAPVGQTKKAMDELGISITNADGSFKSLEEIVQEVDVATKDMTESQRQQYLTMLAGQDGVRFLTFMLDAMNTTMEDGRTQWDHFLEATSGGVDATEVAAKQMDNLKGSMEEFFGALETLSIRVGSIFIPAVRAIVDFGAAVIRIFSGLPTPILAVVSVFGLLASVAALVVGALLLLAPPLAAAHLALVRFGGLGAMVRSLATYFGGLTAAFTRFAPSGLSLSRVLPLLARGLGLVAVALRRLLFANPMLTALSLAIWAFQSNFLGFGDAVRAVAGWIADAFSRIVSWLGRVTGVSQAIDNFRNRWSDLQDTVANNVITRALLSIEGALRGLSTALDLGWLDTLADKFRGAGSAINEFWEAIGFGGGGPAEQTLDVKFNGDEHVIEWLDQTSAETGDLTTYAIMHVDEDGSLTQVGEIIDSYTDENDPNLIHVKVKTDEGDEFWTTTTKDGVLADAKIRVGVDKASEKDTRTRLERISDGLRAMEKELRRKDMPFLADLVGFVADGVEGFDKFRREFDRFRRYGSDPVHASLGALAAVFPQLDRYLTPMANKWLELSNLFQSLRTLGVNPVSAALLALGNTFPVLNSVMEPVANRISQFVESFENLRARGLDPVQSALIALGQTFPTIQNLMTQAAAVVRDLTAAFGRFMDGDFAGGFDLLQSAASRAWGVLQEGVSLLGDLAVAVADWVVNVGVPRVIGAAQDIWDAVNTWVRDTAWPQVKETAAEIAEVALKIGRWVRDTAPDVMDFVSTWIRALVSTVGNVAGEIAEAAIRILRWARDTAPPVLEFVSTWVRALVATAGNVAGVIAEAGLRIAKWVRDTAPNVLEFVSTWVRALVATAGNVAGEIEEAGIRILAWSIQDAGDLLGSLKSKVVEWLAGFGITSTDLITVGTAIVNALGDAIVLAITSGSEIYTDLLNAFSDAIGSVKWEQVGSVIGEGLALAIKAGVGLIVGGAVVTGHLLGLFVEGLGNVNWSTVGTAIGNFLETSFRAGIDFLKGVVQGLFDELFDGLNFDALGNKLTRILREYLPDQVADALGVPEIDMELQPGVDGIARTVKNTGDAVRAALEGGEAIDAELVMNGEVEIRNAATGAKLSPEDIQRIIDEEVVAEGIEVTPDGKLIIDTNMYTIEGAEGFSNFLQQRMTQAGQTGLTGAGQAIGAIAGMALAPVGTSIAQQGATWGMTLQTATSALGAVAMTGFSQIPLAATPPLIATAQAVATHTAGLAATGAVNFGALVATAQANFPLMQSIGSTAAAAMNISVVGSMNAMSAGSTIAAAGMQAGVALSTLAMQTSAVNNATTMQTGVNAATAAMRATSSATVSGMQAGIAASMLFMKNNATNNAQTMATNVINAARLMGTGAANAVRSGMNQIPGIIQSVGAFAASVARGVGAQIGNGVASGMMSALGNIRAAANAMINEALRAAQARAIIESPSKLFEKEVGEMLPEGAARGVYGGIPAVSEATDAMIRASLSPLLDAQAAWDRMQAVTVPMAPILSTSGAGNVSTVYDIDIEVNGTTDPEAAATATVRKLRRHLALAGGITGE